MMQILELTLSLIIFGFFMGIGLTLWDRIARALSRIALANRS